MDQPDDLLRRRHDVPDEYILRGKPYPGVLCSSGASHAQDSLLHRRPAPEKCRERQVLAFPQNAEPTTASVLLRIPCAIFEL